ncbi:hypothetical protein ACHAXT_011701 [Thalassiosira profunda]
MPSPPAQVIPRNKSFGASARSLGTLGRQHLREASEALFYSLRTEDEDSVSSKFLLGFLERAGLRVADDVRFARLAEKLDGVADVPLTREDFIGATEQGIGLIKKVAENELSVPNFAALKEAIEEVYDKVLPNRSGENAGYIPELRDADPEKFGISVCTVDGQQFSIGDADDPFCIQQSCSKPLSYLLALSEFGTDYVHGSVGLEPSGRAFNELVLKDVSVPGSGMKHSIPHNPMINAGAMMTCSMVYPELTRQERLEKVIDYWKELSGGIGDCIGYSSDTYKSESGSADQNWCLAYMMKEFNAFPECFNQREDYKEALEDTLELYFSICSIMNTCRGMSVMGASLANGGLNPFTGKRLATSQHVRNVLPLMLSSGMYDYSGRWSFDVGVPAKSGVGGCVFLVVPNVCGISIFSPRLDENGNSVRGVAVATELCKLLKIHNFEVFSSLARTKIDLRTPKYADEAKELSAILFAASNGDVGALNTYYNAGSDLTQKDYDGRTALHLAATEGRLHAVAYLIRKCPPEFLNLRDRWGTTALECARHFGHTDCADALTEAGCEEDDDNSQFMDFDGSFIDLHHGEKSNEAPLLLMAARDGDLDEAIKMHSTVDVGVRDYDSRSALHLAACEGHLHILKYIAINFEGDVARFIRAHDRWGNSAIDDAKRYGHVGCVEYLQGLLNSSGSTL